MSNTKYALYRRILFVYLCMGRKAILDIRESDLELNKLLLKQKTLKGEKRLKSLLAIKSGNTLKIDLRTKDSNL